MFSLLAAFAATIFATTTLATRATFYGGNLNGGTCSFTTMPHLPAQWDNLYGTALSGSSWDSSAHCGACIRVHGPNGHSITAMIVDQCPECASRGLDLFPDAFAQLGPKSKGVLDVDWEYVTCPIRRALEVHMKSGVSQYWFSAQIVYATKAVADLHVSTDGGKTWKGGLQRTSYNFFENASGFGTEKVAVRAISIDGDVVEIKNVPITSNKVVRAKHNF